MRSSYVPTRRGRAAVSRVLNDAEIELVTQMHADGWSRGAIGKRLGCTADFIDKVAAEENLTFSTEHTTMVNLAMQEYNATRRQHIANNVLGLADRALHRIHDDTALVYNFGGKDNSFASEQLDHMPPEVEKTYTSVVETYIRIYDKLTAVKDSTTEDSAAVDQWLAHMIPGGENNAAGMELG